MCLGKFEKTTGGGLKGGGGGCRKYFQKIASHNIPLYRPRGATGSALGGGGVHGANSVVLFSKDR